jgi:hypothetical protein
MPPPGFEPGTRPESENVLYPLSYEGNRLPREASRGYSALGMVRVVHPCKADTQPPRTGVGWVHSISE